MLLPLLPTWGRIWYTFKTSTVFLFLFNFPSIAFPFLQSFFSHDIHKTIHSSKVFPLLFFPYFQKPEGKLSDLEQKFLDTQSWPWSSVLFPSVANTICNCIRKGLWWSFPALFFSLYRTTGESSGAPQTVHLHFKVCVNLLYPAANSCGVLRCRVEYFCANEWRLNTKNLLVCYHLHSPFIQGVIEYLLHLYSSQNTPEFITFHGAALGVSWMNFLSVSFYPLWRFSVMGVLMFQRLNHSCTWSLHRSYTGQPYLVFFFLLRLSNLSTSGRFVGQ